MSRRRAVSEIVAVLLLVAIAVGMGILVYAFAGTSVASLGASFGGLLSGEGNSDAERFVVEQATFCTSTSQIGCSAGTGANVYVGNVGTISSTLVSVYIVDQSTNSLVKQVSISTPMGVGTLVEIPYTTLTFSPMLGNTYLFKVTSSLGNSASLESEAL